MAKRRGRGATGRGKGFHVGGSLPGYAYRESSSVRWPPAAPCMGSGPSAPRPEWASALLLPRAPASDGPGPQSLHWDQLPASSLALPPRPQGAWSRRPARLGALLRPRSHRCAARRRGPRLTPLAAASASSPHAAPPVAPSPPRAGPASQGSRSWGGRGLRVPGRGEQRRLVLTPEPP